MTLDQITSIEDTKYIWKYEVECSDIKDLCVFDNKIVDRATLWLL